MRIVARRLHLGFAAFGLFILVSAPGCLDQNSAAGANVPPPTTEQAPEALKAKIDRILDYTLNARLMTTRDQAAWQIVHGIIAYGRELPIEHDGQVSSALDYLLAGGDLKGWVLRPGDKGVIAVLEAGSKTGEGHPDQWLGCISPYVTLDDVLVVGGKQRHIRDLLTQAQWEIYDGMEASWILMAAVKYLPLDASWTAKDGSKWTFERVARMEASQPLGSGACGGTHRLYALAITVNRYVKETGTKPASLKGGWKLAYDRVNAALQIVRNFQRPDGTFSSGFFDRSTESADLGSRIYGSGHTLEFVAVAANSGLYMDRDTLDLPADERSPYELSDPWIVEAVNRLCDEMDAARAMAPDCGPLYHAAHGLRLYRDLRFGPREPHLDAK